MKNARVLYKFDTKTHQKLKKILKYKKISLPKYIKNILSEEYVLIDSFNSELAYKLYSCNLNEYKNMQSYYISLDSEEEKKLAIVSKKYGLTSSELISKIALLIYKSNLITVEEDVLSKITSSIPKDKTSITFFVRIDRELYENIHSDELYNNLGHTDLTIELFDEAIKKIQVRPHELLEEFQGYTPSSKNNYILKVNIPTKHFIMIIKNCYKLGESPYSIFHKILFSKNKKYSML